MDRTKVLTLASVLLFALPVFAQTTDTNGTQVLNDCPKLSITMERGARDARNTGQVSELQKFLASYYKIDSSTLVTGYFGPVTQGRVIQFQKEQGLPTFGIAGSLTRAAIAKVCGSTKPATPSAPSSSTSTPPVSSNIPTTLPPTNALPTLSATPLAGPAALSVTFATNGVGSGLSVDFGDGSSAAIGSTSISHTYTTVGTFNAILKNSTAKFSGISLTIGSPNLSNKSSCTISASSNSVTPGQPFTLLWSSQNSTSASLAPADGPVGVSGSKQITLGNNGSLNNSTFTLSVTGPQGSAQCSTTVTSGFPGAPTGSIDQSSLTSTGQVTITGLAVNSAAVFVALVSSSYSGSIEWRQIYAAHSYVTFSSTGVYPVVDNKWSVPLGTVAPGTYKVFVYDNSTIQQILAQDTLVVKTSQSY